MNALRISAAKQAMDAACRCMFGAEPANASWLYFLHYCNAAGGIEPLISALENSGQELKIKVCISVIRAFIKPR